MIATLHYYWTFPFVRYALAVGVLIALCASLFGVTLVLKRLCRWPPSCASPTLCCWCCR